MVSKPKLWLTYAWKDNEDQDVDHVVSTLKQHGVEVVLDRNQLLAGKRLWDGISQGIFDASVNGWAIFTTENSLNSEPCMEELAYALDRTLRTRGASFPLVGIFPQTIDREKLPSAIAVRKYVTLNDPHWAKQIYDTLVGTFSHNPIENTPTFGTRLYQTTSRHFLEVWPRTGSWPKVAVGVPVEEGEALQSIKPGPKGTMPSGGMAFVLPDIEAEVDGQIWKLKRCDGPINSLTSLHIQLHNLPSKIAFGEVREGIFHASILQNESFNK